MYIYVYICINMYIYICIYIHTYIYIYMYKYIYTHTYIYSNTGMDGCVSSPCDRVSLLNTIRAAVPHHLTSLSMTVECIYIYMYSCIYVCIYIHIYIFIYIYIYVYVSDTINGRHSFITSHSGLSKKLDQSILDNSSMNDMSRISVSLSSGYNIYVNMYIYTYVYIYI
jgi:hypothetical protein